MRNNGQMNLTTVEQMASHLGWQDDFLNLKSASAKGKGEGPKGNHPVPSGQAAQSDAYDGGRILPGQMQLHQFVRRVPIGGGGQQLQRMLQGQQTARQMNMYQLVLDMMTQCYKLVKADGTWSWVSEPGERVELIHEGDSNYYLHYNANGI